jgi:hypothetical protein
MYVFMYVYRYIYVNPDSACENKDTENKDTICLILLTMISNPIFFFFFFFLEHHFTLLYVWIKFYHVGVEHTSLSMHLLC